MFSMLPLSPEAVLELRKDEGIYMASSGRFNVAGLSDENVDRFSAAVAAEIAQTRKRPEGRGCFPVAAPVPPNRSL